MRNPMSVMRKCVLAATLLAVILLVGACDASSGSTTASGNILPGRALTWKTLALPSSMMANDPQESFSVSPMDGRIAYACGTPTSDQSGSSNNSSAPMYSVWATDTTGAAWSQRSSLPALSVTGGYCSLNVASVDGQSVVAVVQSSDLSQTNSYLSTTGGRTWSAFDPQTFINTPIITPKIAYAVLSNPHGVCGASAIPDGVGNAFPRLCSSVDGLKTWQPIDATLIAAKNYPEVLHYNPTNGSLLVQTDTDAIYTSTDGGKTWLAASTPGLKGIVVSPDNTQWRLCGLSFSSSGSDVVNTLQCSDDGGQSWSVLPALDIQTNCAPCSNNFTGMSIQQMYLESVLPDGTVMGVAKTSEDAPSSVDIAENHANFSLYRLTPKGTQWQSLGPLPFHDDVYPVVNFTATGQLWHPSLNQAAVATYTT